MRSRLDGELVRVFFTEGQRVKAGQVLAEIDARPYQVALAQAEGSARRTGPLANVRADLQNFRSLFERQLIPRQQLMTQESLVKQVEGSVQSNDAQVNNAKLQLSFTKVVAPISGGSASARLTLATLYQRRRQRIVVITEMQPISVLFTVPRLICPRSSTRCAPNLTARRGVGPFRNDPPGYGTLRTVDNQIDTTTERSGSGRSSRTDEKLFPNQFVNINLKRPRRLPPRSCRRRPSSERRSGPLSTWSSPTARRPSARSRWVCRKASASP